MGETSSSPSVEWNYKNHFHLLLYTWFKIWDKVRIKYVKDSPIGEYTLKNNG